MTEENTSMKISRTKSYFFYMIIVLMFVEILDTYSTLYPTAIPSKIIEEFLSDYSINVANSMMALVIAIATLGTYFVFLNQFFADKFGRKILLVFTVFGMAFSSLLLFFSTNIIQYTIYLFLLYIFFSSDIWTIYLNEESPAAKRATWTNIVLIGGLGGAVILFLLRSIFISDTISNWRGMTLFAIFLGFPLGFLILFSFKETSKFQEMKEKKLLHQKTFNKNLKILFKSSNRNGYFAILLSGFIINFNYVFRSLLESFITNSSYLSQDDATLIILLISLCTFIGYIVTGIIADKYGRKVIFYIYSILQPISIVLLVMGVNLPANALIIVALSGGVAYLTSQCMTVLIRIVTIEITPTEARGMGTGFKSLIAAFGMTIGLILSSISIFYLGLGITFILFSLPYLIIIPIIHFFLKETKGIDLSDVKS
jgi:putative MFS transporter